MSHTTATASKTARAARTGRLRGNAVRITAATVTALAALTLTACGSDDSSGTKTEGKADSTPSLEAAAKDANAKNGADSGADTDGKGDSPVGQGSGTGGADSAGGTDSAGQDATETGGKGPGVEGAKEQPTDTTSDAGADGEDGGPTDKPCTVADTRITLEHTGGTIPAITLKLTNTGSTACNAYHVPLIGYPDAQAPLAVGGDKPHAVRTVAPGESTTATIGLGSEDGSTPHREKQLTVTLVDADNQPLSGEATVSAPAGAGLLLDDDSSVTYWGTGLDSL
ncbi:DUF4232 domain-containing protein [Streptomyces sp. AC536]|uniref:DUF4232 domain-containing protein n=1 Tax=Streptomyces buecherae TaxID=2763006 RepID=UPI00164D6523|nr:DUF4232 domain-containing protein [Streptomyces buecherae]MBC3983055.1 DUF4232 domain-containing protein [Streptomyces buecherae]QNJ41113.1 DUF4232 domain-containing protein [Streptomyces buecherae]